MSSAVAFNLEFASKFIELFHDQAVCSQETFGSDQDRGPIGALKHLEKEAKEAYEAFAEKQAYEQLEGFRASDEWKEEFADCFLLLLDASRRAGIKMSELVELARAKHEKNKRRKWPAPTSDEPVFHDKNEGGQ